jgi:hypothetical protein
VKISDHMSGDGTVDLELVYQFGDSDSEKLGSLLGDSFVSLRIEENGIVLLFLYLDLSPALLLGLSASTGFLAISSLAAFALIFCILALRISFLCL